MHANGSPCPLAVNPGALDVVLLVDGLAAAAAAALDLALQLGGGMSKGSEWGLPLLLLQMCSQTLGKQLCG